MESICSPKKQFSNAVQELVSTNADLLRDIVIGIFDGLSVPFAITAVLGGSLDASHLIIASCISGIIAVCIYLIPDLQISLNKNKWASFLMKLKLTNEHPANGRADKNVGTIALSHLLGGFIPLFPYIIFKDSNAGFRVSCVITILVLVILGYFKSRMTGQTVRKGIFNFATNGVVAAIAAFLIFIAFG